MVKISCLATVETHKLVDGAWDCEACAHVKQRLKAAAMQVALDLRRDGYHVELDVHYLVAGKEKSES